MGKRKTRRAEEKGYLKCTYQKWKLVVFKLSQKKNNLDFFSQKNKNKSRFAQCANLWFRLTPQKKTPFVWRENGPSGSRLGYWQLSRTSVKSKIILDFFRPPLVFGNSNFWGPPNKKCKTHNNKKKAIHPWRFH